jgi:hypothetical protein
MSGGYEETSTSGDYVQASGASGPSALAGNSNVNNGDQNVPSGYQNVPSGDQNVPSGDQNVPSGDQNVPSGDQNGNNNNQTGGKRRKTRKMNKGAMDWVNFVKQVYKTNHAKNPNYKYKQAMKDAAKMKHKK